MSGEAMLNSMVQELKRNLAARLTRNNEKIGMVDVVNEAAYLMAINILISEKQLRQQTNGQIQFIPSESSELMWNCLKKTLDSIFGNFPENQILNVKEKYNFIMKDSNSKDRVNRHYNELYGSNGGDVI